MTTRKLTPDNIRKCKDLPTLKQLVSYELVNHELDPEINWHVASIVMEDKDPDFSDWLEYAIRQHNALKLRTTWAVR